MSLARFVAPLPLGRRRREGPVSRALLDVDAGALIAAPTVYPYAPGSRPIRPFVGRIALPLRGARSVGQLFPREALIGRTMAHVPSSPAGARRVARSVAGADTPARGYRRRPWLFGGTASRPPGSNASPGSSAGDTSGAGSGCVGC